GARKPPNLIPLARRAGSASARLRELQKPRATAPEVVYTAKAYIRQANDVVINRSPVCPIGKQMN
ncbi:MAG: hypothetical protein ACI9EZ_001973, partial [Halobacteriales archaeon]